MQPPPPNPYGQPDPYGGQPNPYGQPQQPFAPAPQQPRGTVSLDVIGEAWKLVQPALGQWILAILILFAISFVVSFVTQILQAPFMPRTQGQQPGAMFWLVSLIAQVIGFIVNSLVFAGLIKMAISHVRTGVANLNEMFSVTNIIGPILLGALLSGLIFYAGLILCIVPGIIAILGLAMTQPLIVDQNMQPVDAMKRSWETMKPHLGSMFVLGLVLFLLNMAGVLACCVGIFVTYPISVVSIALVYRDLFGVGASPAPNTGYTPPPIASPGV